MADSYLRCSVCGRETMTHFGHSLKHGWPKCCDYTMTLLKTNADVGAATTGVLREQTPAGLLPDERNAE